MSRYTIAHNTKIKYTVTDNAGNRYKPAKGGLRKSNAGGGSLKSAHEKIGLVAEECTIEEGRDVSYEFMYRDQKTGDLYRRLRFEHFNAHLSGYREGVYEVVFQRLAKIS